MLLKHCWMKIKFEIETLLVTKIVLAREKLNQPNRIGSV